MAKLGEIEATSKCHGDRNWKECTAKIMEDDQAGKEERKDVNLFSFTIRATCYVSNGNLSVIGRHQ